MELGLRHDGGDAENGAGMDIAARLVVADSGGGLSVDLRIRTLLVHQAEGFSERGISLSISYDPTPTTPLGFSARVSPACGGDAMSGAKALWGRDNMGGMRQNHLLGTGGNRLDTEVGLRPADRRTVRRNTADRVPNIGIRPRLPNRQRHGSPRSGCNQPPTRDRCPTARAADLLRARAGTSTQRRRSARNRTSQPRW